MILIVFFVIISLLMMIWCLTGIFSYKNITEPKILMIDNITSTFYGYRFNITKFELEGQTYNLVVPPTTTTPGYNGIEYNTAGDLSTIIGKKIKLWRRDDEPITQSHPLHYVGDYWILFFCFLIMFLFFGYLMYLEILSW